MRKFLVAGNWKMNGDTAANNALVDAIVTAKPVTDSVQVLICPPFPYLAAVAERIDGSGLSLGSQNVSEHDSGAHTGETAAAMLTDVGCEYAIVGHSERRAIYGETSQQVAAKYKAALTASMAPILCVGETLADREADRTEQVVNEQLEAVLDANGVESFAGAVIAYEPVWAIGTGMTATPEQAQDVHQFIRGVLARHSANVAAGLQILYGGSVNGDNAAGLFTMSDIDGGLIGGASLKSADFVAIVNAAVETVANNEV